MTLAEARTLVSTWLDDVNNGYFTTAQLNVWLNNAQREVQKQLIQAGENWYMTCAETTMVVDQEDYVVPSDFLKLHRMEIILSGTAPNEEITVVEPITPMQKDLFPIGHGTPSAFYFKKNRFVLVPPPDTALTLRILYSYLVADLSSDGQTFDVPTQYQEYIAVLTTLDGLYRDGRDPTPFLEKKQYYLELMKQDAEQRQIQAPRTITVTQSDGFEALF